MWRKLGFQIYKTENGFKTYFKWQRDKAINEYHRLESATFSLTEDDIEKYMTLRKLLLVDSKFHKSLSLFEKVSFENYLERKGLNEYGKNQLNNVIEKWMNIFFEDGCREINKKELGKIIALIRINGGCSLTYLANVLKVDVKRIRRIEKGEVFPTLQFMYSFANFFSLTIDYILEQI
jgi:DNA-binding XRE family transcriptional regulator